MYSWRIPYYGFPQKYVLIVRMKDVLALFSGVKPPSEDSGVDVRSVGKDEEM